MRPALRRWTRSSRSRLPQRTLLITAEHQRGQLLAAGIGEQPDQPRHKVIRDKHHASSLPSCGLPCTRRCR